jgi:hypothetical protein
MRPADFFFVVVGAAIAMAVYAILRAMRVMGVIQ